MKMSELKIFYGGDNTDDVKVGQCLRWTISRLKIFCGGEGNADNVQVGQCPS